MIEISMTSNNMGVPLFETEWIAHPSRLTTVSNSASREEDSRQEPGVGAGIVCQLECNAALLGTVVNLTEIEDRRSSEQWHTQGETER